MIIVVFDFQYVMHSLWRNAVDQLRRHQVTRLASRRRRELDGHRPGGKRDLQPREPHGPGPRHFEPRSQGVPLRVAHICHPRRADIPQHICSQRFQIGRVPAGLRGGPGRLLAQITFAWQVCAPSEWSSQRSPIHPCTMEDGVRPFFEKNPDFSFYDASYALRLGGVKSMQIAVL